jgi:hypothetical protein
MSKATQVGDKATRQSGQQYLTDLGNAHRLVARYGRDLQYVPH